MAWPLGGHPTLAQYMHWARDQGFRCLSGVQSDDFGKPHGFVKIFKDSGPSVVVVGVKQTEHLAPTYLGYLNRRLGVQSPWIAVDAPELDP